MGLCTHLYFDRLKAMASVYYKYKYFLKSAYKKKKCNFQNTLK